MHKARALSGLLDADSPYSRTPWTQSQIDTGKYGLGNMLGSIAYLYGDRMVYRNN